MLLWCIWVLWAQMSDSSASLCRWGPGPYIQPKKTDDTHVKQVGYIQGDGPYGEFEERLAVFLIQKDGGQGTCSDVGNGSCKKGTHHQGISQLQHVECQQQDCIEGGVQGSSLSSRVTPPSVLLPRRPCGPSQRRESRAWSRRQ